MKIGLVTRYFPPAAGGMSSHAEHLARELSALDEVVVYAPKGAHLAGVSVSPKPLPPGGLLAEADMLVREEADIWLLLQAGYTNIAHRIDAPVCVYFHGNDFLAMGPCRPRPWLGLLRRIPLLSRVHGEVYAGCVRRDIRATLGDVAAVFTNSENSRELIQSMYGCNAEVFWPGVAAEFFQPRSATDPNEFRVLTVAALIGSCRRKNVDGVLSALALLPSTIPWRYQVIGDGELRPELEALAKHLDIADRVTFSGMVSREALRAAYASADLMVLASKASANDVEGFGIVYAEASASGLPVLASRAGGSTDAVCDGRNGVLIDSSNPEAIAAGIQRFYENRSDFPADQVRGYAEKFRWPAIARNLHARLQQTVAAAE